VAPTSDSQPSAASGTVTVVGAGNIGAALAPHLARMPGVGRVVVIDHDRYEPKNLRSQDILPADIGKPKAVVQARRLRRITPAIDAVAIVDAVENVPLGLLRGDVILGCLDAREPRRVLNQAAWRLGVPWVDAGVSTVDGLLARVTVYVPGPDAPCLECAWDTRDYESLEQVHPCDVEGTGAPPTNSTSALGALAAALQAIECQKLIAGDWDHVAAGRQVLIDARTHAHWVTSLRRRPSCRFDHETWRIDAGAADPSETTLGRALEQASRKVAAGGAARAGLEGRPFIRRLQCLECGHARTTLRLAGRLRRSDTVCRRCRGRMVPVGFETTDWIDQGSAGVGPLGWPLERIGFRPGDIVTFTGPSGRSVHEEIGNDRA